MADYKVIGAAAVLPLKSGSERYLYRNAVLSDADFTPDGIKHALSMNLIANVEVVEVVAEIILPAEVVIPEGDPSAEWTAKQLQAYAGTLSIDLGKATKKDDILAVIVAASK